MYVKLTALIAFMVVIFLAASVPASAGNCGNGNGNGNGGGGNPRGCPPNKHGVPGPIAGVGLPFLIVGMVAYRRRRKLDSDGAE